MDTPEKNKICTPISKFEDSPIFNYINSLSPIKPVKSIHTIQAFNSLNFASPPSVFTSPHISSLKESRFLRRHQFAGLSKPDFSGSGYEDNTSEGVSEAVQLSDMCAEELGCPSPGSSTRENALEPREVAFESPAEQLELATEFPKTLKSDCGSPDGNMMPCNEIRTDTVPEMAGTLASLVQFVQDDLKGEQNSIGSELELHRICRIEQEVAECNLGNFIFDAADLLIFNSPIKEENSEGQDHKTVDPGTISFISTVLQLPQDNIDDLHDDIHKAQSVCPLGSCEQPKIEIPVTQLQEVGKTKLTDETEVILSKACLDGKLVSVSSADIHDKGKECIQPNCKPRSRQQRSIRRRCLVFEMGGALKKKPICYSNDGSSDSLEADGKVASTEKQLVSVKSENGYASSMLPGIGLHLNALATTSKDGKVVTHEALASGRHLINIAGSVSSFASLTCGQNPLGESLTQESMNRDLGPINHEAQVTEEASQTPIVGVSEELSRSSPKRKRRMLEHIGESSFCKRCNCKKSKCLKLYCECFAAGLYCVEPCSCQDCHNTPVHEDTVLETRRQIESRNPLAFAPKVIRTSDSIPEFGEESNKTPASARHKRGCNCKKSSCLKKYCECFQGGVGCSISCRCEGCKNSFGRKDGTEAAEEEEETETCEKNPSDTDLQNTVVQKSEEEHSELAPPITPSSRISRPLIQLPFTFTSKPLGSSLLAVGSSPDSYTSQKPGKSDFPCRQPKFEKHLQMIPEDDTPEILKSSCSDCSGVKSVSPNSKRVSPPHQKIGSSPAWRSRKLILRSIPSFPSLTPRPESSDSQGKLH